MRVYYDDKYSAWMMCGLGVLGLLVPGFIFGVVFIEVIRDSFSEACIPYILLALLAGWTICVPCFRYAWKCKRFWADFSASSISYHTPKCDKSYSYVELVSVKRRYNRRAGRSYWQYRFEFSDGFKFDLMRTDYLDERFYDKSEEVWR